ncbi:MAG: phosphoglycerate kinase [Patescibacteria group bacterium]
MNLSRIDELDVFGQRVLLRMDTDVPTEDGKVLDDTRLRASIPTIKYLIEEGVESIVVLGHRGRPGGKTVQELSLSPVAKHLEKLLEKEIGKKRLKELDIQMAENLRFNPGEEKNSEHYTDELSQLGDIYINDAFGASGREHASIVGLPQILPSAAGFSVLNEVEALERVIDGALHPVVFVLGGGKGEKALFVDKLLEYSEWVLAGGLLPKTVTSYCKESDGGVCVSAAHLTPQGHDITPDSARNFAQIITDAKTVVWAGPMGDIDNGYWDGTEVVGKAIAESSAYKVAGGGDTIHAINKLGISSKLDHISTGGGAMLEFLAYGDLPGLRALRESADRVE